FERLAVVARALAFGAFDEDIGQEVHLDPLHTLALAGLAAAALYVKAEAAVPVAADFGFAGFGEGLADEIEYAGVGRGVTARGATNGRLVDFDDFVDTARADEAVV